MESLAESRVVRLRPGPWWPGGAGASVGADAVPLVLLSDWAGRAEHELLHCISAIMDLRPAAEDAPLPMVLVADDLDPGSNDDPARRARWVRLMEAGATPLEPESEEQRTALRNDPVKFACRQLAVARQATPVLTAATVPTAAAAGPSSPSPQQAAGTTGAPGTTEPRDPAGYLQFAHPVTRLSEQDMEDLISGQRRDDWRFEDEE